jgi:hypothetical protein
MEMSKNEIDRDRKAIDAGKYEIEKRKHDIDVKLFELEKENHIVSKEKYRLEKIKDIVALRDRKSDLLAQIILLTEIICLNDKLIRPKDITLQRFAAKIKLDTAKKNYNELEINLAELRTATGNTIWISPSTKPYWHNG